MKAQLKGTLCEHCSGLIVEELKAKEGVNDASINFLTGVLTVRGEIEKETIRKIVKKHEKDVHVVFEKEEEEEEEKGIDDRIKILLSLVFLGFGFFFKNPTFHLIAYAISGYEVLLEAVKNFFSGKVFDENFLMGIATIGALFLGEYEEAAAVMIFYLIGEYFEDLAVDRSKRSIRDLLEMKVDRVHRFEGEHLEDVLAEECKKGDRFLVKAGERIMLDGIVIQGESTLNTSSVTGESVPRSVKAGEKVISSTINMTDSLVIEATEDFYDSTVSRIIRLVEESSEKKAKTEHFITRFANIYTPIVVALSVINGLVSYFFFSLPLDLSIKRSLIFLVISCPCALVLSIPLSFFSGLGSASKLGLMMKGANYLEALDRVKHVVLDKTGTLTEGRFEVRHVTGENTLLYAALLEQGSNHPIASSILSAYEGELRPVLDVKEISGEGLVSEKESLLVGNGKLMERFGVDVEKSTSERTVVYVAKDHRFVGTIEISDELKRDVKEAIRHLKESGIQSFTLLSGDREEQVQRIAEETGIDSYKAELLPEGKLDALKEILKKHPGEVLFCGDGTNDSPSLALADIGVSMGDIGSEAALEASDMVLIDGSLMTLKKGFDVARFTKHVVKENILFILLAKAFVMLLAAFGMANMWMAVFADVGVALLAVLNATRILRKKL
ncbi:heavy metal translocating P-type ATPase [Guggenheimella bovis]